MVGGLEMVGGWFDLGWVGFAFVLTLVKNRSGHRHFYDRNSSLLLNRPFTFNAR